MHRAERKFWAEMHRTAVSQEELLQAAKDMRREQRDDAPIMTASPRVWLAALVGGFVTWCGFIGLLAWLVSQR